VSLFINHWAKQIRNSKQAQNSNVPKALFPSFRQKPESRKYMLFWTPAFAGVTVLMISSGGFKSQF